EMSGRKRYRPPKNERTTGADLPDIDEMYRPKGMLLQSLEDPDKFRRIGFEAVPWKKPRLHQHVANTDAAVNSGTGHCGFGYVIRNRKGKTLTIGLGGEDNHQLQGGALVAAAEMTGVDILMTNVNPEEHPHLLVSCDNKETMKALKRGRTDNIALQGLLNNIKHTSLLKYPTESPNRSLEFEWGPREGNFLADWCANLGERLPPGVPPLHLERGDEGFKEYFKNKTFRYFRKRDLRGPLYIRNAKRKQDNNAKNAARNPKKQSARLLRGGPRGGYGFNRVPIGRFNRK
ncbi:hypothetical protein MKX03_036453, partial [Papaver bracteatum]